MSTISTPPATNTPQSMTLAGRLREAMRNGDVRAHVHLVPRSMPADWAVPIASDEVVIAALPTPEDVLDELTARGLGTWRGITALVIRRRALPSPRLDDAERERIADALAELLLEEVK